jgi:hypothetical protein
LTDWIPRACKTGKIAICIKFRIFVKLSNSPKGF